MGSTITEKILAKAAGREEVVPGEIYMINVDFAFGNDITIPVSINEFEGAGLDRIFDKEKIGFFNDHSTPNKDIKSANLTMQVRKFAEKYCIKHCYDVGKTGIEHAFIPEQGLVLPGQVIVGADSHSCTHGALGAFATGVGSTDIAAAMALGKVWMLTPEQKLFVFNGKLQDYVSGKDLILYAIGDIGVKGALDSTMEFAGDTISTLSMDSRFSICNMATEAGAINGIIAADNLTLNYLSPKVCETSHDYPKLIKREIKSDKDAYYATKFNYDASKIEPQVAYPFLPSNTKPISKAIKDNITIDQVVIGSCTNGRLEDMREAAKIIKGSYVKSRTIIIPATQEVYLDSLKAGLLETFVEAGCYVSGPTCGPCLGGHMGVLGPGERAVATTNRNFVGRMGEPGNKKKGIPPSEIYLTNPAIAAASAVLGRIAHPNEIVRYKK